MPISCYWGCFGWFIYGREILRPYSFSHKRPDHAWNILEWNLKIIQSIQNHSSNYPTIQNHSAFFPFFQFLAIPSFPFSSRQDPPRHALEQLDAGRLLNEKVIEHHRSDFPASHVTPYQRIDPFCVFFVCLWWLVDVIEHDEWWLQSCASGSVSWFSGQKLSWELEHVWAISSLSSGAFPRLRTAVGENSRSGPWDLGMIPALDTGQHKFNNIQHLIS